jgi:hypothetical protein
VKIETGIELFFIEGVNLICMLTRYVAEAHVLPDHRAVLCFHQSVVVGTPGPRLGLLNQELIQQIRNRVIDELAAVSPAFMLISNPQHAFPPVQAHLALEKTCPTFA